MILVPDDWPPNFTLDELVRSARAQREGIPNIPTPPHALALRALAWNVLQPLREAMDGPIKVTSGYRGGKLNAKTPGGSTTSQHAKGEAADIVPGPGAAFTAAEMFHHIKQNLPFDQLIWEHGTKTEPDWVHVSFSLERERNVVLQATGTREKPKYSPWKP